MHQSNFPDALELLTRELKNFQDIVKDILPAPGQIPTLYGMDIYGDTVPLNGEVGGDHLIYVDFKKRFDLDARIADAEAKGRPDIVANLEQCRRKAGIAVMDVSGHHATDALMAAMLHQAFLLGAIYELDIFGRITKRLFENLNSRFHNPARMNKFITMIYGEISEETTFRFLSAAHPPPIVFSNRHDRFMDVSKELCTSFPPIGTLPSDNVIDRRAIPSVLGFKNPYQLNRWTLMGAGDILLLYTDGLEEHARGTEAFFPRRLEETVRQAKHLPAKEIFGSIKASVLDFAAPRDDVSVVVIKRTSE